MTFQNISPMDGGPLETVQATAPDEVTQVIARACEAQSAWHGLGLDERCRKIGALGRRILEQRAEVLTIMSRETGRSETECLMNELAGLMDIIRATQRVARQALKVEPIGLSKLNFPGKRAHIEPVPRGVVAIIAPWNYPLGNFFKHLFPALLAGNGVVLKPSELTPRTGAWLKRQCDAVLGSDLVGLVQGGGEAGRLLLDGAIDAVTFTGSVATGKKVMQRAGERLLPCSVELGGKDAAIVLADCEFDRTVAGIVQWSLQNAGQDCSSIERVYVEQSIADRFVERVAAMAGKLTVNPEGHADIGPLQSARQLAIVEEHVADAIAKGATLVIGGKRVGQGFGYLPTVLDHCTHAMAVMRDETFGPVIAIARVRDSEEAIKLANDCRYGLNGSVWTKDIASGEALARRLAVGVALVNNHSIVGILPELPWTGVKETGPGVASSHHAYGTYVRRRVIFVDTNAKPDAWWKPADANLRPFGDAMVAMGLGSLGVMFTLLGLLGKRVKAIQGAARGA